MDPAKAFIEFIGDSLDMLPTHIQKPAVIRTTAHEARLDGMVLGAVVARLMAIVATDATQRGPVVRCTSSVVDDPHSLRAQRVLLRWMASMGGAMIAALFVASGGVYTDLPDVDAWTIDRDARLYAGDDPVVAHPPCARWCKLAGLVEARWGHKRGEDGGCFASALVNVRRVGGVLEHPAYSAAWAAHDLNRPPTGGGWVAADLLGGWTCYVEQGRYGHAAKKATWLYAIGASSLPTLRWGLMPHSESLVSWCGNDTKSGEVRPRVGKAAASRTPAEFRDALIAIARSTHGPLARVA